MSVTKILIIEDDAVTALNLTLSLEALGYEVVSIAKNKQSALIKLKVYYPDIVFIDIELKGQKEGIEIAQFIRDKMPRPFIYLTAHSESNILISAKQTEPYGYIVKPFEPLNLHTTIQMALYRFERENKRLHNIHELQHKTEDLEKLLHVKKTSNKPIVEFGKYYSHDISLGETFYKNKKIYLSKTENAFIRLLVVNCGRTVDFELAMAYIWGEEYVSVNSVRTLVWRLRKKLPEDVIKNASGIGYYIAE